MNSLNDLLTSLQSWMATETGRTVVVEELRLSLIHI